MGNSASVGATLKAADGHVSLSLAKKESAVAVALSSAALPAFPCSYPMKVIRWDKFEALDSLVRSDVAAKRGLTEEVALDSNLVLVFISHCWWHRPVAAAAEPDYPSGEHKGLKFRVICEGVKGLITREGLDPAMVALWCDWFSVDQDDAELKAAGVQSMIHYTTRCSHMLIPVPTAEVVNGDFIEGADPDDCGAYYPEDVADYGSRGWCRIEVRARTEPVSFEFRSRIRIPVDGHAQCAKARTPPSCASRRLTVLHLWAVE